MEMEDAGKEGKLLAEERGDYHEGVPAITVIVDAGWSKHSHKHTVKIKIKFPFRIRRNLVVLSVG